MTIRANRIYQFLKIDFEQFEKLIKDSKIRKEEIRPTTKFEKEEVEWIFMSYGKSFLPYFLNTYLKEKNEHNKIIQIEYPIIPKNQELLEEFNLINSIHHCLKVENSDILKLSINDYKFNSLYTNSSEFKDLENAFQQKLDYAEMRRKLDILADFAIDKDYEVTDEKLNSEEDIKADQERDNHSESPDWEETVMKSLINGNGEKFGL